MGKMKKLMTAGAALTLVLALGISACASDADAAVADVSTADYAVEEMLVLAIQDEYNGKAEYEALIETFDAGRPFTNIVKAEQNHIDALIPLFEAYGYAVPEDNTADNVEIPATLAETYAIGVEAEIANIELYENFLANNDVPEDVTIVFENLIEASRNHLAAFERGVDREGGRRGEQQWQLKGNRRNR